MIIDFHSHDFPDAIAVRAMAGMCAKTEGVLWAAGDGTLGNHLDSMEKAGVDMSVLCQIATRPSHWKPILERSISVMDGGLGSRARKKIIPFGSVHPFDPDFGDHLAQFAAAGVKGVKFHPYYQDFSINDPAVYPVFAKIADLGLVVVCHCGGDVCWRDIRGYCGPKETVSLLKNVRSLKFVAAHLGGCYGYGMNAVDALLECGAYIDTAVLPSRRHYDEEMRLLSTWPADRLLFATDFPWADIRECVSWVESLRDSSDHEAIFSGNAKRLLGI